MWFQASCEKFRRICKNNSSLNNMILQHIICNKSFSTSFTHKFLLLYQNYILNIKSLLPSFKISLDAWIHMFMKGFLNHKQDIGMIWMWHRVALGRYFSHRLRVHNKQRVGLATIALILNAQQFHTICWHI